MTASQLFIYLLKFYIPAAWSIVFRAVAYGYTSKRRVALGFGAYTAYVLIVPALFMRLMGYGAYTHIAAIVMTIGSMSVLIFTTDTVGKTIFLHLAQGGMVTVMSVILNMARTLMGFSYHTLLIVLAICSPILFYVGLRFWAKPMRFLVDNISDNVVSLLLLPLLTLVVVSVVPVYPPQNFSAHPVFCTLLMLAVELAFFMYLYTLYRNLRRISVLSREKSRMELLSQEISSYQAYLDNAQQSRHDLRHHDALLTEYLERGDTDKALSYLRAHSSALTAGTLKRFCAESTVNAVLRIYERRAEEAEIEFGAVAELPETLPLEAPELCGLFSNVLENAVHAAKEIPGGFITLETRMEDENLLLEVINSTKGQTEFHNDLPVSQKPGGGTGTRSVLATAKRHGGLALFSQTENEFRTRVILPLKIK